MPEAASNFKPEPPRHDERDSGREFIRVRPREPHEKYAVPQSQMKRGMDYFWAATKLRGMPNPRFSDYWRAGWRPVKAADFPDLSGLNLRPDQALIDLGIVQDVQPDGQIILNDLMLMMRPAAMTAEAQAEQDRLAEKQVNDHLRLQREKSNRAIGPGRTRISRQFGPPDEVPSDAEVEMG